MNRILDASALLALLNDEPGAERVASAVAAGASIGAVNLGEVAAKLADWGVSDAEIEEALGGLGLKVVAFDEGLAYRSAALRASTRDRGLSLGDRACLALGLRDAMPIVTADHTWAGLSVGLEFEWLR
jgi:ribonuclease VapC